MRRRRRRRGGAARRRRRTPVAPPRARMGLVARVQRVVPVALAQHRQRRVGFIHIDERLVALLVVVSRVVLLPAAAGEFPPPRCGGRVGGGQETRPRRCDSAPAARAATTRGGNRVALAPAAHAALAAARVGGDGGRGDGRRGGPICHGRGRGAATGGLGPPATAPPRKGLPVSHAVLERDGVVGRHVAVLLEDEDADDGEHRGRGDGGDVCEVERTDGAHEQQRLQHDDEGEGRRPADAPRHPQAHSQVDAKGDGRGGAHAEEHVLHVAQERLAGEVAHIQLRALFLEVPQDDVGLRGWKGE